MVGGVVYVGSSDDGVFALNADTGTRKWLYVTGGAIVSSPVISNGVLFIGSGDSNVYALDAGTGKL